jgi:D-sedoheptulose 7-phosphate isomerase
MNKIRIHFEEAHGLITKILADPAFMHSVGEAGEAMAASLRTGSKIISCGNGGSMCDAMHFAEELSGRYRDDRPAFAAVSISDPSHLTCVGNDYGFRHVFSRYVEAIGRSGDTLLAISTSGNSENIIEAAKSARNAGMTVVALTGKDGARPPGRP